MGRRAPGGRTGVGGRLRRRLRRPLPLLICIDVEPDERQVRSRGTWRGFDVLYEALPELRRRLGALTSGPVVLNWFVRADHQIADRHGEADWAFTRYADRWPALERAGDEIGLHAHAWRRRDDGSWLVDHGDEEWVESCFAVGLDAYRASFGRPPPAVRGGDRFLCERALDVLDRGGVLADLTVEPRMPAAPGVGDDPATGSLPDYTGAPEVAYRPARGDFRRTGQPSRRLWELPLTAGGPEVLYPWMDEYQFSKRLNERLSEGPCTHLAFAIRSDLVLDPAAWKLALKNLERAAYIPGPVLGRRVRSRTATEVARSLG